MNEAEISAVVLGVTEIAKNLGLPTKFCGVFSVGLAVLICLSSAHRAGGTDFVDAGVRGLLIGLAVTGGYSAVDKFVSKSGGKKSGK